MIRAAIIGHPVAHSLSPLIHNHWIAQYGLQGHYDRRDVAPGNLAAGVRALIDEGYAGFNVTVPHKQAIMKLCHELDESAKSAGAVNTVRITGERIEGRNTDAFGFMENLRTQADMPKMHAQRVMILGAGGAARAALYALQREGVSDILIANRTEDNARRLADEKKAGVCHWSAAERSLSDRTLLVNTTTLGMHGMPPLEFDLAALPPEAVVYDVVYRPLMTGFLQQAKARGHTIVTGLGMLLHQARPAFESWFGVRPDIDRALLEKIREAAT